MLTESSECRGIANGRPAILSRDREITLALSAAPPHIASHASIYVLDAAGVIRTTEGTNGLHVLSSVTTIRGLCIRSVTIQKEYDLCYRWRYGKIELAWQHKSQAEVEADIAEGFRSGRLRSPTRISVAYMLSKEGRFPAPSGPIMGSTPHVRFYAPYVRSAEVGTLAGGETLRLLPAVVHGGSPLA